MKTTANSLLHDLSKIPKPVWYLIAGLFINRFGAFVFPFLTLLLSGRGFSPAEVSLVIGAMSFGHLFGPFASGYLSDAIGRRNTMVVSLLGSGLGVLSLYYCETLPMIMLVGTLQGFFSFLYGPASSALMTDLVAPEDRVTAFALCRLAMNAGFAAGPSIAGLLYHRAPALIFYGDAFTTFVFALIVWKSLPHGLRTIRGRLSSPQVVWRSWIEVLGDVRKNAPYLQFLLVIFFGGIAFIQAFSTLSITVKERGLDPAQYGLIMGLNGLLIALLELPLIHRLKRLEPRYAIATGYALIGLGCALFGWARDLPAFALAMTCFTLGEILALPIGMAYSSNLAPKDLRGRYFGFRGMTWGAAGLLGSLGVWAYGEIQYTWWPVVAMMALVAALIILPRKVRSKDSLLHQSHL